MAEQAMVSETLRTGQVPLSVLMGVPKPGIPGGPQGHLPLLVRGLRGLGVVVREEVYGNPDGARSAAGRVLFVLLTARRLRAAAAEATGRGRPFDIVHLNTAFDPRALLRDVMVVTLLGCRAGKVVLKFHGSDERLVGTRNPLLRGLAKLLFLRIDAAGVLSHEEMENFLRAGFPARKLSLVRNILDPGSYRCDPSFRQREGIPEGMQALLFSARLLLEKGLLDVIRAIPLLRARGHRVLLLCCGDGPMREEAASEARRLGVADGVRMYGHLPEARMREFYANADVLVLPTFHQEGFPMAVFQAVAAGLPVVTTRIRASADYLREPENCLWTEPRDPEMLAGKIALLLDRPDMRGAMAEANRRLAAVFSEDRVAREFVDLYQRLIHEYTEP